jgi:hypothetical protein
MLRYIPIYLVLSLFYTANGQNNLDIYLKNSTIIANNDIFPFWFSANQNGKIVTSDSFLNISDFSIEQIIDNKKVSELSFEWGVNLISALSQSNYYNQLNHVFAGISLKGWTIKAGRFQDSTRYAGLSTSNGNFARSQNSRPFPKVRFETTGYKKMPFLNWLSFKGEYDEGILNDNRYIDNVHLHHKSLYFLIQIEPSWDFILGLEHFVMWGGVSSDPQLGQIPKDFKSYWRYILGLSGDQDFPKIDKSHIAGNHLGTYQLEFKKRFPELDIYFYLSHPFENFAGINLRNWKDNMLGLHFRLNNEKKFISDFVYEYTQTHNQGISDSLYRWNETSGKWEKRLIENYFKHFLYKSGYTYNKRVIGSPLFFPVEIESKGSTGDYGIIRSNRFFSHHAGLSGFLAESIKWKGLLTYIHHLGTHEIPYEMAHKQVSGLIEVQFSNFIIPVEFGLAAGLDVGNTIKTNFGFQFWIAKRW